MLYHSHIGHYEDQGKLTTGALSGPVSDSSPVSMRACMLSCVLPSWGGAALRLCWKGRTGRQTTWRAGSVAAPRALHSSLARRAAAKSQRFTFLILAHGITPSRRALLLLPCAPLKAFLQSPNPADSVRSVRFPPCPPAEHLEPARSLMRNLKTTLQDILEEQLYQERRDHLHFGGAFFRTDPRSPSSPGDVLRPSGGAPPSEGRSRPSAPEAAMAARCSLLCILPQGALGVPPKSQIPPTSAPIRPDPLSASASRTHPLVRPTVRARSESEHRLSGEAQRIPRRACDGCIHSRAGGGDSEAGGEANHGRAAATIRGVGIRVESVGGGGGTPAAHTSATSPSSSQTSRRGIRVLGCSASAAVLLLLPAAAGRSSILLTPHHAGPAHYILRVSSVVIIIIIPPAGRKTIIYFLELESNSDCCCPAVRLGLCSSSSSQHENSPRASSIIITPKDLRKTSVRRREEQEVVLQQQRFPEAARRTIVRRLVKGLIDCSG